MDQVPEIEFSGIHGISQILVITYFLEKFEVPENPILGIVPGPSLINVGSFRN